MSKCVFRDGTIISDYGRPYIVAEVNSSHKGNIDTAKQMIDAAVQIGCDCVKFQSWSAESLYSKSYYVGNPIGRKIVKKLSLMPEQLRELSYYCRDMNIAFSSTPYSEEEVDFLIEDCNVPYIKIASMEINNLRFLQYIGEKEVPVVLSTGMSDMTEIEKAVRVLEDAGVGQMVILHCVSIYPTVVTNVNLNNIIGLRDKFPQIPVGFSDHTEGDAAAVAAVALGAGLIEKHLTLDRSKVGMDNGMATEPKQFTELVLKCRDIQMAMGNKERIVHPEEIEQRKNMRRSVTAARDLHAGDVIQVEDLYAKRPGTGISPDRMHELIGKRVKKTIEADTLIMLEDLSE